MRTKTYHYGKATFKTQLKAAGKGWETTFTYGDKTLFVGNFVHATEAIRWYTLMNREITKFGKKYTVGYRFPITWFNHFISNHLHKNYYSFLDKVFARYNRDYLRAYTRDFRVFQRMKRQWHSEKKTTYLKAA